MLFGTMFLSVLFASVGAEAIGKEGWQSAKWSDRVEQGEEGGSMGEVLTRSRRGRRQVQTKVITFWNELWLWVHRRNPFKHFFWAENSTEEDVTTVQAASGELGFKCQGGRLAALKPWKQCIGWKSCRLLWPSPVKGLSDTTPESCNLTVFFQHLSSPRSDWTDFHMVSGCVCIRQVWCFIDSQCGGQKVQPQGLTVWGWRGAFPWCLQGLAPLKPLF